MIPGLGSFPREGIDYPLQYSWASHGGSDGKKNLPAMWEIHVQPLGWEDPLEKKMATHSSILAWRIPWTEELEGHSLWSHKESDTTEQITLGTGPDAMILVFSMLSFKPVFHSPLLP